MPPRPPRDRLLPSLRPPQLAAAAALLVAFLVAAVVAIGGLGGKDAPSLRAQYGGHGGEPAVRTGAAGRVALDGTWRVALDPRATGEDRGFARGRFGGRAVHLPYVPNAGRITGPAGVRSHAGSVAWYRTALEVPRTGRYALRFESVNHRADVWIDGRRAASHTGTYLPFEARPLLEAGRPHTLVVRADWRDPVAMKAAGWHRTWFNFGGINREVTIRPLRRSEVRSAAVRTTLRPGGAAHVTVAADGAALDGMTGTLARGGQTTDLAFTRGRASVDVAKPALWSPGSPALYDLTLSGRDGEPLWRGRVGLREIGRDGTTLLLNGRPLKLRGASLHEDVPGRGDGLRPVDEDRLVRELKGLGANATRAQHPLSPSLLERLDAAGILVWMGVGPVDAPGAWTSDTPALVRAARDRVRASLTQLQTHPSIFAWNLANEVAGQGHPGGQAQYIDATARELHRRDPGRLVALDVWGAHPPKAPGPMYADIDAIGWTNYLGWYESPYATPAQLRTLIRTQLAAFRTVFPGKVIAVTEFGAEGSRRNASADPGGYGFQARVLRTHIQTYAEVGDLAGMLIWNLRDFAVAPSFAGGSIRRVVPDIKLVAGLNEKGLYTYTGRPKPAVAAVRAAFRAAG